MSDLNFITRNQLAGSQFLAAAITKGNEAVLASRQEDAKMLWGEFEEHLDCARHHFEGAFDKAERQRATEQKPKEG